MEENTETSDDTSNYYGGLRIYCDKEKTSCMMDKVVLDATVKFVEEIKKSNTYIEYNIQKEKLKKHPELFEQVKEYRKMNYVLQSGTQAEELFDKLDDFEKEYEKFRENPLVDDFLRAELAFCRMIQEINSQMMAELDFE